MSGFYQTPVLHCHWAGNFQELPVIAFTPEGREVQIPYEIASALLVKVDDPPNKYEGWDFKLQAGESVTMTANQIDTLQQATNLDQVQQVVDYVLTANEEARVPGTTEEMPQPGESASPATGGATSAQASSTDASTATGQATAASSAGNTVGESATGASSSSSTSSSGDTSVGANATTTSDLGTSSINPVAPISDGTSSSSPATTAPDSTASQGASPLSSGLSASTEGEALPAADSNPASQSAVGVSDIPAAGGTDSQGTAAT